MEGRTICDGAIDDDLRYACDAMVLGSLMKSSGKMGIWPKPESPFGGKTFKDLAQTVRNIRILDVCNKTRSRRLTSLSLPSNCHGLEDSIEASMKSLEAGLDGLELPNYARKRWAFLCTFDTVNMLNLNSEDYLTGLRKLILSPSDSNPVPRYEDLVNSPSPAGSMVLRPEFSTVEKEPIPREHTFSPEPKSPLVAETTTLDASLFKTQNSKGSSPAQTSPRGRSPALEETPRPYVHVQPQQRSPPNDSIISINGIPRSFNNTDRNVVRASPESEVKQTVTDEVQVLTERKLNRTTSFPSLLKEDTKSPVKEIEVTPRVASIEEMPEEILPSAKLDTKRLEVREIHNENLTTTDEEEVSVPSHNFKIRVSKNANKRFSKRF